MLDNESMIAYSNIFIPKIGNTLTNIFHIFTCIRHYNVAFRSFSGFFKYLFGYKFIC